MGRSSMLQVAMVSAMIVGLWLAQAGQARACSLDGGPQPPPPTTISAGVGISLAVPAVIDATMLAFQLGYGDEMLPTELAVVQVILGSAQILYSSGQMFIGAVSSMVSCGERGPDGAVLALSGFIGTFLGSWLIADGVASIQTRRHRARQQVLPTASVTPDGFWVGALGSF